ncbi:MAG: hypothetical protein ACLFTG_15205, partial [Alphaproteobacteria bacterium]
CPARAHPPVRRRWRRSAAARREGRRRSGREAGIAKAATSRPNAADERSRDGPNDAARSTVHGRRAGLERARASGGHGAHVQARDPIAVGSLPAAARSASLRCRASPSVWENDRRRAFAISHRRPPPRRRDEPQRRADLDDRRRPPHPQRTVPLAILAAGLVAALALAVTVERTLARPVASITAATHRLAAGDGARGVPHRERRDEAVDHGTGTSQISTESPVRRAAFISTAGNIRRI